MAAPIIKNNDPLYMLLRQGNVSEFNQRSAAGETPWRSRWARK